VLFAGPKGPRGVPGATGFHGPMGFRGVPGTVGRPGLPGPTGPKGHGADHGDGHGAGPPGFRGPRGERGPKGAPGNQPYTVLQVCIACRAWAYIMWSYCHVLTYRVVCLCVLFKTTNPDLTVLGLGVYFLVHCHCDEVGGIRPSPVFFFTIALMLMSDWSA